MVTKQMIVEALKDVYDPEIPTLSLVDMGIITGVEIRGEDDVKVTMTPTFVGCPAIDVMRKDAEEAVRGLGISNVEIEVNFDEPWSTNKLTDAGRAALLKHGLAPAEPYDETIELQLDVLNNTKCPYCGSHNTDLRSPFGPTLCRSLHYCNNCLQAFEGFKPV
jgi:ring-1,2-phenylacetyl-CoA epoxidase subunit PaaD